VQHLLAVYLPEIEIPKFFLDTELSAAPPHRVLLEKTLTSRFSSESTDGESIFAAALSQNLTWAFDSHELTPATEISVADIRERVSGKGCVDPLRLPE
jgi:hypothetical protein